MKKANWFRKFIIRMLKKFTPFKDAVTTVKAIFHMIHKLEHFAIGGSRMAYDVNMKMMYAFTQNIATSFVAIFLGFWRSQAAFKPLPVKFKFLILGLLLANAVMTPILLFFPWVLGQILGVLPPQIIIIRPSVTFPWKCLVMSTLFSLLSTAFWVAAIVLEEVKGPIRKAEGIGSRVAMIGEEKKVKEKKKSLVERNFTRTGFYNHNIVSWVTALLWLIPVAYIIINTQLNTDARVITVYHNGNQTDTGPVAMLHAVKGGMGEVQSEFQGLATEMGGACGLVLKAVMAIVQKILKEVLVAAELIEGGLENAFEELMRVVMGHFKGLREVVDLILSVMHLVEKVIPDLDHVLLALLFACPAANVIATIAGAVLSTRPNPMTKGIQTLRQTLAWTGLCVSFTLLGMSSVIEAVKVPIFDLTFKVDPIVLVSAGLNALCLISYFSSVVDTEVPMLDDRNALLGQEIELAEREKKPLLLKWKI